MGEVYRARDPRLGRDVAVKVLPPAFATDRERLQRFEQEARAAAALNHPNILAIHDIGYEAPASGPSPPYIVSELLEGETLRQRLQQVAAARRSPGVSDQGPLPARKAIEYAVQIARGLAAAHEKGIVHRDLKPENIFVTADSRVKILDFGLAKLTAIEPSAAAVSTLPTVSAADAAHGAPDTLPGVVFGTVGYMSPEQIRGFPADHRSDIFSLGAILYEMLAGHRAFRGETAADTMGAILSADPSNVQNPDHPIPSALLRIVDRCLEKVPSSRFQSASDLTFAMEALSGQVDASDGVREAPRQARVPLPWVAAALLLLTAVVVFAIVFFGREAPVDSRVYRASISVPGRLGASLDTLSFAVSPDGRRLAFVGPDASGRVMLWVRPLDSLPSQPLAGTEGAAAPFWSPDNRFVAFVAGGKLMKIEASGGPPSTVAEASLNVPGAWSRDDVILFTPASGSPLWRVPAAGGRPSAATALDSTAGETAHAFPVFLPDGRRFLYRAIGGAMSGLYAGSLDSPERTRILDDAVNVQFSDGAVLYLRDTTLVARPFDASRLAFSGDEVALAERVWVPTTALRPLGQPTGAFSSANTGVVVYQSTASAGSQLVWFDREGKPVGVLGDPADYADLFLSPDGLHASASIAAPGGTRDIWTFDVARNLRTRFTFDPGNEFEGIWTRDNSRIAFNSSRDGGSLNLYVKSAGSTGPEELLVRDDRDKYAQSWSPDGRFLLYIVTPPGVGGQQDLWFVPTTGDRRPSPYLTTEFTEGVGAQFSPDGRWVVYTSTESGRQEVYVASFPVPSSKWPVSTNGGLLPRWRGDGREIFYFEAGNSRVMSAEVTGDGATLRIGAARPLFNVRPAGQRKFWDVSPDGRRFLVNTALATPDEAPLTLLVNWPALLLD